MSFHIAVRALAAAGAYLATALVAATAIVWLRRLVSPIELRSFLGFFFIASLAAGLEPATVKAAVLRGPAEADAIEATAPALLGACAVKALAAAPLLALLWRLADPHVPLADLIWLPAAPWPGSRRPICASCSTCEDVTPSPSGSSRAVWRGVWRCSPD